MSLISTIVVFLFALLGTILIEISVAYFLGYRDKKYLITIISIDCITNPTLNYLFLFNTVVFLIPIHILLIVFLEILVVIVEWKLLVFILGEKSREMFKLSFLMNFLSCVMGMLILQ